MWSPTHVQVLVKRSRGLILKGKNGTNDAFVTIALGKEKYQTSVKEKATESIEWCEQCELAIPEHGNTAEICLTVLHRNFLGVDEFLGQVTLPLKDFDVYERPKTKWYTLRCKPGQNKTDYRGDLEVRTAFTVKSVTADKSNTLGVSSADLKHKDKHKGSLQSLNKAATNFGGSLLSLGTKEKKNLKKLAKTVGHKVEKVGSKAKRSLSKSNLNKDDAGPPSPNPSYRGGGGVSGTLPSKFDLDSSFSSNNPRFSRAGSDRKNRDPGVQSDDEDDMFRFDALSHRSSGSSLNVGGGGSVSSRDAGGGVSHGSGHSHTLGRDGLGHGSKTSTPASGVSMENVEGGVGGVGGTELYRRSFGTPLNPRKDDSTPKSSRSYLIQESSSNTTRSSGRGSGRRSLVEEEEEEPVLDEWEAKLLGKKSAVPYKGGALNQDTMSTISQLSQSSQNSSELRNNSRMLPEPAARNSLPTPQETPSGRKKIIPVGSDFESSPSPESPRSPASQSPATTPVKKQQQQQQQPQKAKDRNSSSSNVNNNSNSSVGQNYINEDDRDDVDKKRKSIGLKLKTSYSFKDKDESKRLNSTRDLRLSSESLNRQGGHSRNHSDGSSIAGSSDHKTGSGLPPSGSRVVLGRETTPTPTPHNSNNNIPQKLPRELYERFEGQSREDLIQMVLTLQDKVERQAKKQSDLEDYIDGMLMKVIQKAPEILQKNAQMEQKFGPGAVQAATKSDKEAFNPNACKII